MMILWLGLALQDAAGPWIEEWSVPEFELTDQNGRVVTRGDLRGRVWVVDFIFTRCAGPCPMMSGEMRRLQADLPPDARLLSFSVDPERDTPAVLRDYAEALQAQPGRWLFLTGDKKKIFSIALEHFKAAAADPVQGSDQVIHSTRFYLVDRLGRIRRYYSYAPLDDPEASRQALQTLRKDARAMLEERPLLLMLPAVNASLNALCAVLLLAGLGLIKSKKIGAHRACMISAVCVSALFLTSYLFYHFHVGSVKFPGEGMMRTAYFSILISHTILAVTLVPLVPLTLVRALRERFDAHRRIARITFPTWLYVSVTGVIVYLMLYGFDPVL